MYFHKPPFVELGEYLLGFRMIYAFSQSAEKILGGGGVIIGQWSVSVSVDDGACRAP